jgi:hypothetical protein
MFQVLTATSIKSSVFWYKLPCIQIDLTPRPFNPEDSELQLSTSSWSGLAFLYKQATKQPNKEPNKLSYLLCMIFLQFLLQNRV